MFNSNGRGRSDLILSSDFVLDEIKMARNGVTLLMLCLCKLLPTLANSQQCSQIGLLNGLIFPEYSRGPVEHALHWSKAQSKLSQLEGAWSTGTPHISSTV